MAQLLVRGLEDSLVSKLKRRAAEHGVSAEEEHRRILREVLLTAQNLKPTLIQFLVSNEGEASPEIELDLSRSQAVASRDIGF
ncbi:MAG: DNA-binding protein [Verrucomicrobiae bacterium]|nr:DNA-binding protein [Verrucomicrobiae bacterium]